MAPSGGPGRGRGPLDAVALKRERPVAGESRRPRARFRRPPSSHPPVPAPEASHGDAVRTSGGDGCGPGAVSSLGPGACTRGVRAGAIGGMNDQALSGGSSRVRDARHGTSPRCRSRPSTAGPSTTPILRLAMLPRGLNGTGGTPSTGRRGPIHEDPPDRTQADRVPQPCVGRGHRQAQRQGPGTHLRSQTPPAPPHASATGQLFTRSAYLLTDHEKVPEISSEPLDSPHASP